MKLLVIDWDFFFEDKLGSGHATEGFYDWSHRESEFFIEGIWGYRAAAFFKSGLELPGTTGEEKTFWDRVTLNPGSALYYGDSNARAVTPEIADGITEVVLFDAHHDSGYSEALSFNKLKKMAREGRWTCDNWMIYYACLMAKLTVKYPRWKTWAFEVEDTLGIPNLVDRSFDDGKPIEGVDRVYVCRSGAWVPPWLDEQFLEFVNQPPVAVRVGLELGSIIRKFDLEECRQLAHAWKAMMDETVSLPKKV